MCCALKSVVEIFQRVFCHLEEHDGQSSVVCFSDEKVGERRERLDKGS